MLDLAILGLLKEQPLHGYELKKQFGDVVGRWASTSYGSLYPALARLEAGGEVEAVEQPGTGERASFPMTGALSGEVAAFKARKAAERHHSDRRNKKVYALTDLGDRRLVELLTSDLGPQGRHDDRNFALRLAFCRYLTPEQRIDLFSRRRGQLAERLAERRRPGRRADHYLRSLREHDTQTITHDLDWLDRLIDAERAALPAPGHEQANAS
jgi:DNA-binding PadR family transcriptional regulator